jgi:hypothetical protein
MTEQTKIISPEEVFGEGCQNCANNPQAKKPLVEMKQLKTSALADKIVKKLSKDTGLSEGCIYCFSIREFMALPDSEKFERLKQQAEKKNTKSKN